MIHHNRKEKLQLKNDNYYKRDVAIIKLKKKFKDTVPICVKKHTKIEAELLHNKEPLYMSGWTDIQKPKMKEFYFQKLQLTSLNMCPCDTNIKSPDVNSMAGNGCKDQARDPRLEFCATSKAKAIGVEPDELKLTSCNTRGGPVYYIKELKNKQKKAYLLGIVPRDNIQNVRPGGMLTHTCDWKRSLYFHNLIDHNVYKWMKNKAKQAFKKCQPKKKKQPKQ